MNRFKRFDVRTMLQRGVEPFPFIHEKVSALKPGDGLIVVAPFLPSPLIERLGSEGFASRIEPSPGAGWLVYFWRSAES